MLPLTFSAVVYIVQVLKPKPALEFDERLWSSLRPTTKKSYQRALKAFRSWCIWERVPEPQSIEELDGLLARYFGSGIKLAHASTLTAAVENTLPRARPIYPSYKTMEWTTTTKHMHLYMHMYN